MLKENNLVRPASKQPSTGKIITGIIVLLIYGGVFLLEQVMPATSMLFTVLKKGATYALVAVSMNLLNGFTGLFSLGQAGFMLIGAYTYAILSIPMAERAMVFSYYDGGLIQFTMPVIPSIILAGCIAALFAFLIGLPVLKLKSDYLAIATLGFAEIMRAVLQWDKLGPIANGASIINKFPTFNDFNIKNASGDVTLYQLLLRARVQVHTRRRDRRRGHGHQPCQAQDAVVLHQLLLCGRGRRDACHVLQLHTGHELHLRHDV